MKTVWLVELTVTYEGSDVLCVADSEAVAVEYAEEAMEQEKNFAEDRWEDRGRFCTESGLTHHSWMSDDKEIDVYEVELKVADPAPASDY